MHRQLKNGITAILLCYVSVCQAQLNENMRIYFGTGVGMIKHETHGARIDQYEYRNRTNMSLELPQKISFDFKLNVEAYQFVFIQTGLRFVSRELTVRQSYWVHSDYLKSTYLQIPLSLGLRTPDRWFHPFSVFASAGFYKNMVMNDASLGEFRIEAQSNYGSVSSVGLEASINRWLKVVAGYNYYNDISPSHTLPNYNFYYGNGEYAGTDHYYFKSQEIFLNLFFLIPRKGVEDQP